MIFNHEAIHSIIDRFDFETVRRVMFLLAGTGTMWVELQQ